MRREKVDGLGDKGRFPAADLEKLYHNRVEARTQGKVLNQILCVSTYEPDAWYLVTANGVEKIDG